MLLTYFMTSSPWAMFYPSLVVAWLVWKTNAIFKTSLALLVRHEQNMFYHRTQLIGLLRLGKMSRLLKVMAALTRR